MLREPRNILARSNEITTGVDNNMHDSHHNGVRALESLLTFTPLKSDAENLPWPGESDNHLVGDASNAPGVCGVTKDV